MEKDFWVKFWNSNKILNNSDPQLQIGRSINKKPIDKDKWKYTLQYIENLIELNKNDRLLDLCAGNGLISVPFSEKCHHVTAVDISEKFIDRIRILECHNITTFVNDARKITFDANSFNKVIIYFALQHFDEKDTISLFEKILNWLENDGLLFIGDIPDANKIWTYFNNKERESVYFDSIKNNQPIIGYWFTKEFILKLGNYIGFKECKVLDQPDCLINSHYRFDIILKK